MNVSQCKRSLPLDVQQGGGPAAAAVLRAPESSNAICRVFMLQPPPTSQAKPSLSAQQQALLIQLLSDGMATLTACLDPSPLPKATFSVIRDRRTVRFKSSPPFPS